MLKKREKGEGSRTRSMERWAHSPKREITSVANFIFVAHTFFIHIKCTMQTHDIQVGVCVRVCVSGRGNDSILL